MSNPSQDGVSDPAVGLDPVTLRVLERVQKARTTDALTPRSRRRRADRLRAGPKATPEQAQDARSLREVFLDMGDSYRAYRRRTGEPVSAEVKGAAERFRRQRDLTSLAAVAASLDRLQGLTW